ncbi:hypothetical protein [Tautonia plasticadhaerens]|uniref:hypothetical protein n=1 Tax=Tautonia plasticadhaerens TaxID=2527974 RepID=UPI001E58D9FA|nr:hypothetical protein [Tautonia plasticadhaerens]
MSNCKIRCRSANVASSSRDRTRSQNAVRSDQTSLAVCRSERNRCSWSRCIDSKCLRELICSRRCLSSARSIASAW